MHALPNKLTFVSNCPWAVSTMLPVPTGISRIGDVARVRGADRCPAVQRRR